MIRRITSVAKKFAAFLGLTRKQSILAVIGIVLFIISTVAILFHTTNTSITVKKSESTARMVDLRNSLANMMTIDLIHPGRSGNLSFLISQLRSFDNNVATAHFPAPTVLEFALHPGNARSLIAKNNELKKSSAQLRKPLLPLADELAALQKFIEYNPREDFSAYGTDATDDAERIERAKNAITAIAKRDAVTITTQNKLYELAKNTTSITNKTTLEKWTSEVESLQAEIIQSLHRQQLALKQAFRNY